MIARASASSCAASWELGGRRATAARIADADGDDGEEEGKPRGSGEQTPHEKRQKPGRRLFELAVAAELLPLPLLLLSLSLPLPEEEAEEPRSEEGSEEAAAAAAASGESEGRAPPSSPTIYPGLASHSPREAHPAHSGW